MFFAVSKVFGFFTLPSNIIAVLFALAGALYLIGWRRGARRVLGCPFCCCLLSDIRRSAIFYCCHSANDFRLWQGGGREPHGIIVVAGDRFRVVGSARRVELDSSPSGLSRCCSLLGNFRTRVSFSVAAAAT